VNSKEAREQNKIGEFVTGGKASWTLFIADLSGGSVSTLNSFSLDITAVPEPVNVALGTFGGLMGVGVLVRSRPVKRRLGEKLKS
jgi:hypothetical protein